MPEKRKLHKISDTPQIWANAFLTPIDHLIASKLRIGTFVRYCDDVLVFDDDKGRLQDALSPSDSSRPRPRRRESSRFAWKRLQTGDSPPSSSASLVIAAKSATQQDNAKSMHPAVYLVASRQNGTLYTGVTSNLVNRIWEHRSHRFEGFTANHDCTILVWFEMHATMTAAFVREKSIKKWRRAGKVRLIENGNPGWADLWPMIIGSDMGFPHSRE